MFVGVLVLMWMRFVHPISLALLAAREGCAMGQGGMRHAPGVAVLIALVLAGCSGDVPEVGGAPVGGGGQPDTHQVSGAPDTSELDASDPDAAGQGIDDPDEHAQEQSGGAAGDASWPDTIDQVSSGVARISVNDCQGNPSGTGSGFVVDDGLIVTAAHVVEGRPEILVALDGRTHQASIVGIDPLQDLALLSVEATLDGHHFSFITAPPRLGEDVTALGYPLGREHLVSSRGTISANSSDRDEYSGTQWPVTQTDTPVNPGNSGGPLILQDGQVVGVVIYKQAWTPVSETDMIPVEGTSFALAGAHTAQRVEEWRTTPMVLDDPCLGVPAQVQAAVVSSSDHPQAAEVTALFTQYTSAINSGDWETGWVLHTAELQDRIGPYDHWVTQLWTSFWLEVVILDVRDSGSGFEVDVLARTQQAASYGPDGQTCSDWAMTYRIEPGGGGLLIHGSTLTAIPGPNPESCA